MTDLQKDPQRTNTNVYVFLLSRMPESAELVRVAKLMLLMGYRDVRSMRCYQMKIFHRAGCDKQ